MYIHYVAMRYVLSIGNLRANQRASVFDELSFNSTSRMFKNLTDWLYQMISYKFSAIYIKDHTVEYQIEATYLVLCGLLGSEPSLIQTI